MITLIKKVKDRLKQNKELVNYISIRSVSFSIKQILVAYKSKLLNINLKDSINFYSIKDVSINVSSGILQKNNIILKNFIAPILYESQANFTFHAFLYRSDYNTLKLNDDLILNNRNDLIYFKVKENKHNYYHFVHDNLLSQIFILEKYKRKYDIIFNSGIADHINDFMGLLSRVYKKKFISFKNKKKIRIKNNIIFAQNLEYHKIAGFHSNLKKKNKPKAYSNSKYSIYNFPIKHYSKKNRETIYNHTIDNLIPNDYFETLDSFKNKLLRLKIIKDKNRKKNYYCKRLPNLKNPYKNRIIEDEKKFEEYLISKGFEVITFENLSIEKVIEIMHNSNTIIGLHGANLTNSVFKKNGNLVEIMSGKGALSSELYMHLAEQRKINYYRIQFKKNKKNETVVDYKKLNNLLNKIKK